MDQAVDPHRPPPAVGLLLAAGAGRRMGRPKALVRAPDGTSWLRRSISVLHEGGCDRVVVVLGAAAAEARALLDGDTVADGPGAVVVEAPDWADGMGASLRRGLRELDVAAPDAQAAVIHLVDLPDVGPDVVRRLVAEVSREALVRATFDGRPGHPVLVGRRHWAAMADSLSGDTGARRYLDLHGARALECGDLAGGRDVDAPSPGAGAD